MEHFFKKSRTLLRLRECPLGPHVESFVKQLIDKGYAKSSVNSHLHLVADFICWLEQQNVSTKEITEEHVKQYFEPSQPQARKGRASSLRVFIDFLRHQGVIPEQQALVMQTPVELLASEFSSYLRQERVLA